METKTTPRLERIPTSRFEINGIVGEYIHAVQQQWLLKIPSTNPAILEMFADRDKQPPRDLLLWSGEFAGKYLTGAVQILRLTQDAALKATLTHFVARLVSLQADDGYLGPFPRNNRLEGKNNTWDTWGHYHIMLGLLLWHDETGDPTALPCVTRMADLLCRKFLNTGKRIVDTGSPEMNQAAIHSLCLLYKITRTREYLELAQQIVQEFADPRAGDYVRAALAGQEFFQTRKPRWESLHPIQSLIESYWITGDNDLRQAFEHLWWSIAKLDRHNNGGFSSGEQAQGNPYHRGAIETCCTVAWMAMSIDMLRLTGNSLVADELELSTLNQVLGYQHRSGKWCTYNTPMDGTRVNSTKDISFQIRPGSEELNCCSANAPRGLGMISDWALMQDGQGLALNWYGPSTMSAVVNGTTVALKQTTTYPQDGRVILEVTPDRAAQFSLKLRIPSWSAATKVSVNGQSIRHVPAGKYLVIDRHWQHGDQVQIDLDLSLHFWVGEHECAGLTSIYHGPILMVHEPENFSALSFSPQWKKYGTQMAVNEPGASVEYTFEGSTVVWTGYRFYDSGQTRVTIDGREIAVVDQYGPGRELPFFWEYKGLAEGRHTIKLTALEQKNPESRARWINVVSLDTRAPVDPAFDADQMGGRILPTDGPQPPLVLMEFTTVSGRPLRLRDYATAGEEGVSYISWLKVQNIAPAPFSSTNPWRSSRVTRADSSASNIPPATMSAPS